MFNFYQPSRIHFGQGQLEGLAQIASKYGSKCLLVTTPNEEPLNRLFDRVKSILSGSDIEVVHFDRVEPNPSVEIVNEGFALAKEKKVDFVLAVGGGSSIDTAKIIALTNGLETIDWDNLFSNYTSPFENYEELSSTSLPLLAVPTTSGTGSQVTQAAVITRGIEKITVFHPGNFSKECIIDPELMKTLPPRITAATGFDAFTHAFESYINKRASIFTEIQGIKAMELVVNNLPGAVCDGQNMEYRENLAIADTLAGTCLANAGASAPHPLGEIIGGFTHISHGETLAVVFPGFIKGAWKNNITKFANVARLFNADLCKVDEEKAAEALYDEMVNFLKRIGLYKTLRDFNVSEEQLEEILASPVLGFLPFGGKEELQAIIRSAY